MALAAGEESESVFESVFDKICEVFNITYLREYQKDVFKYILEQKDDCFLSQPTGSGKSLLYQALPLAYQTYHHGHEHHLGVVEKNPVVLVISPLQSLIKDQEKFLKKIGIKVLSILEDEEEQQQNLLEEPLLPDWIPTGIIELKKDMSVWLMNYKIRKRLLSGDFNILFSSPESILEKYRKQIKDQKFSQNLIAVFVDESHCVKKWGSRSKEAKAFRSCYNDLSHIRALLSGKQVPIIAMTATATKETRTHVINNLCLVCPKLVIKDPQKGNIKYSVVKYNHCNVEVIFKPILEDLKVNGYDSRRIIIFCRTIKDTRGIFQFINNALEHIYTDYLSRPYAKYHSRTEDLIKEHVLQSFSDEKGKVRVLISTIAFGMGVDCKGLHDIIHFGPPSELEDYFQESGRAGRDDKESFATLIYYKHCIVKCISTDVRAYCHNEDVCRRKLLLQPFDTLPDILDPMHTCCDICQKNCLCGNCGSNYPSYIVQNSEIVNESSSSDTSTSSDSDIEEVNKKYRQRVIEHSSDSE